MIMNYAALILANPSRTFNEALIAENENKLYK